MPFTRPLCLFLFRALFSFRNIRFQIEHECRLEEADAKRTHTRKKSNKNRAFPVTRKTRFFPSRRRSFPIARRDRQAITITCMLLSFSLNRGKTLLGYSDAELSTLGGYDLVHYDDLAYVASAHQERECLAFLFDLIVTSASVGRRVPLCFALFRFVRAANGRHAGRKFKQIRKIECGTRMGGCLHYEKHTKKRL